jgi:hypothetical protein
LIANILLDKTPAFDHESLIYHGYALAETWVGRLATNVGDVTGQQMYDIMFANLNKDCLPLIILECYNANVRQAVTHYVKDINSGDIGESR